MLEEISLPTPMDLLLCCKYQQQQITPLIYDHPPHHPSYSSIYVYLPRGGLTAGEQIQNNGHLNLVNCTVDAPSLVNSVNGDMSITGGSSIQLSSDMQNFGSLTVRCLHPSLNDTTNLILFSSLFGMMLR